MKDDDPTLERTGIKKPDLQVIIKEVQGAQTDSTRYSTRMAQARAWWMCEWAGMSTDGRRWEAQTGEKSFPWDGCSDSRLRIVDTIVKEHVTLCLAAFWGAKKQVKSIRPFTSGREVQVAQNMMDWRMDQMKRELLTVLPQALSLRFGAGLAFIKVEWEQQREVVYVPITLDDIGQLAAQLGLGDVIDMIQDPDKMYDGDLIPQLQQLSPILPTAEARRILNELREAGQSELPISSMRVNKPKWSVRRPMDDILFPSETCDIQQTRFTCERELVSETELTDRIITDGYDDRFVEEALRHKGKFASWWMHRMDYESGSDRNLIELNHVLSWRLSHNGTPCLYRTVFNESVAGDELYAIHRKFEYDHGQFPFVALRRSYHGKPLLSSIGIAEEAYTDEWDIKRQQDGLNNHTDMIHAPAMIVPTTRAKAVAGSYGPNAVMTAMRPEAIVFQPLPPMDQVPVLVVEMIENRLNRRYAIIGGNVDPEIKALRRQQIVSETNGELDLALDQTLQLQYQYESDEDILNVAGGEPWEFSRKQIQEHSVTSAIDINMVDAERASMKLDNLIKMMPLKQAGGVVFNTAARMLDVDLGDAMAKDEMGPQAMEKERQAEYNAVAQIMGGIEPVQDMMANPQFRLEQIQQIMMQPQFQSELQMKPNSQKMLETRVKGYQAQIQQYQQNPQIGRQLQTKSFNNDAATLATAPTNG